MAKVKCAICGKMLDKDKDACVKVSARRYAHYECSPNSEVYTPIKKEIELTPEQKDKKECEDFIKTLFNIKTISPRIRNQLNKYLSEGKSYKNIYLTLVYWYNIKNNDISKANGGIGIVPYIYEEAENYYKIQMIVARAAAERGRLIKFETEDVCIKSPLNSKRGFKSFFEDIKLEEERNENI